MRLLLFLITLVYTPYLMASSIQLETIKANGFEFNCRTIGDAQNNKVVVLLHGFPESSHMWESTMQHLHQQGFYCIAPDMRGYSANARPKGVKNYSIQAIASDIIQILEQKNITNFHLIGHDWGSVIGWSICGLYPQQVQSFVPMSVPHLIAFSDALKHDEEQKKMSGYMKTFQLRGIPELVLKANNCKRLKESCWYLSPTEQVNIYTSLFKEKRALTAALNYYRCNFKYFERVSQALGLDAIKIPTTLIWGNKDMALGRTGVENTAQYMKGAYELVELDASHWLIQDTAAEVWNALDKHFAQHAKD